MSKSPGSPSREAARRSRLAFLTVKALSELDPPIFVTPDTESGEVFVGPEFIPADLTIQHLDLRIRLILLIDAEGPQALADAGPLRAAELLLKHWPETTAVGLVANDSLLSCLIVEPFEVESSIGTPSGLTIPPTPRRDAYPVAEAVRKYLEVVVPSWDRVPSSLELSAVGYEDLAPAIASDIQQDLATRPARIPEKKDALNSVGTADARWASDLVLRASSQEVAPEDLAEHIKQRVGRRR
jgi:hypothetical protein